MADLNDFIRKMPKAELHIHIEGSFEPELMFAIASRNGIKIKYSSVDEVRAAYKFNNLQEFLDIYYAGAGVLIKQQDFYDLTMAYLRKAHAENVLHTEIFFDPQTHTERGIAFDTVVGGILEAMDDAKKELGISSMLILSFLRHLSEEAAFETLEQAMPWKERLIAVGLDSSEVGNPPQKFERVYKKAKESGFLAVAHAGEEGPAEYVWDSLKLLHIDRLDHGNHSLDDPELVHELARREMGLTVCPLSNYALKVTPDLTKHPIKKMLDAGLKATVNSDDPAYFGGYMNANFIAIAEALKLAKDDLYQLARNAFEVSFLSGERKAEMIARLDAYFAAN
jgi:adenosine deaminase